jgi:hypothetical protein
MFHSRNFGSLRRPTRDDHIRRFYLMTIFF